MKFQFFSYVQHRTLGCAPTHGSEFRHNQDALTTAVILNCRPVPRGGHVFPGPQLPLLRIGQWRENFRFFSFRVWTCGAAIRQEGRRHPCRLIQRASCPRNPHTSRSSAEHGMCHGKRKNARKEPLLNQRIAAVGTAGSFERRKSQITLIKAESGLERHRHRVRHERPSAVDLRFLRAISRISCRRIRKRTTSGAAKKAKAARVSAWQATHKETKETKSEFIPSPEFLCEISGQSFDELDGCTVRPLTHRN